MWHKKPCPQVLPAVVHPTKCNVNEAVCEYIVPEIHPVHTKNITYHNYKHVHSFPHTTSNENVITNQQFMAPPVAGAQTGPGFGGPVMGAQMAPGFGGPVMGAQTNPAFGGPVMGAQSNPAFGGPVMGAQSNPAFGGPVMGAHHKKPWGCC